MHDSHAVSYLKIGHVCQRVNACNRVCRLNKQPQNINKFLAHKLFSLWKKKKKKDVQ